MVSGFEHDRTPHRAFSADNVMLLTVSAKALQNDFATMKNIGKIRVLSFKVEPNHYSDISHVGLSLAVSALHTDRQE